MSFSAEQVRLGLLAAIAALLLALNVQVYVTFGQGRAIEVYDTSEALASDDIKSAIKAALSDCTLGTYDLKPVTVYLPDGPETTISETPSTASISERNRLQFSCDTN